MATSILEQSLIEWVSKFNSTLFPCTALSDLYSGEIINQIVYEIFDDKSKPLQPAPKTEEWLELKTFWLGIVHRISRFMVKNLDTINPTLEEQIDSIVSFIDIECISRKQSTKPLLQLLELIVSCSVQSKSKENCVMQIMQLRKDQQSSVMSSIQGIMSKFQKKKSNSTSSSSSISSTTALSQSSTTLTSTLTSQSSNSTDFKTKYYQLKSIKDNLQSRFDQVQSSNDQLSEQNSHLILLVEQLESQISKMGTESKELKCQLEEYKQKQQMFSGDRLDLNSPLHFKSSSILSQEENAKLKSSLASQEKLIAGLQQQISSLSPYVARTRELEDEIEMLKDKVQSVDSIERTNRKMELKTIELNTALSKIKQLEETIASLQSNLSEQESLAKQVPLLKSKIEQYKNNVVELHGQITESTMSAQMKEEQISQMKLEIQSFATQLDQSQSIISELENNISELQLALSVKQNNKTNLNTQKANSLAQEVRSLNCNLQSRNKSSDTVITQLEKELSAAHAETDAVKQDLEDKLDTMSRLREKYQNDYIATSDSLRQSKIEKQELDQLVCSLKSQIESIQSKNSEIEAALKTEICQLNTVISDLNNQIKALEVEKNQLKDQKSQLEQQEEILKNRVSDSEQENNKLKQSEQLLQTHLEEFKQQNQQLKSQIEQIDHQKILLETESSQLKESNEQFKQKTQELMMNCGDLECKLVIASKQVEEKQLALESSQSEKELLQSQLKHLKTKQTSSLEDLKNVSVQYDKLKADFEEVKQELATSMISVENLSSQLAQLQDDNVQLNTELDDTRHTIMNMKSNLASLELENESLENTLEEYMNRELQAVEQSLSYKNEIDSLQMVIQSRDAELQHLQSELEKALLNESLKELVALLRSKVASQQKQLAILKEEQRSVAAAYNAMSMELYKLRLGGIPSVPQFDASCKNTSTSTETKPTAFHFDSSKAPQSPSRASQAKRVPLRERATNLVDIPTVPSGISKDPKATRKMSLAGRALESRPRQSLVAQALRKR